MMIWAARLELVPAPPEKPTSLQAMQYRLKTPEGQARYAQRKTTSEPVFGIIKEVMGFRRFCLRGLEKVKGAWRRVCLAYIYGPPRDARGNRSLAEGKVAAIYPASC
jgi:hypothetical protein